MLHASLKKTQPGSIAMELSDEKKESNNGEENKTRLSKEQLLLSMRENKKTQLNFALLYSPKILTILSTPEQCNFSNWGMLACDADYRKHYEKSLTYFYDKKGDFYIRKTSAIYLLPDSYPKLYDKDKLKAAFRINFEVFQALARNPSSHTTFLSLLEQENFHPIFSSNIVLLSAVINNLPCENDDREYILKIICLNNQDKGIIAEIKIEPLIVDLVLHWLENFKTDDEQDAEACLTKLFDLNCVNSIFSPFYLKNFLENPKKNIQNFIDNLPCEETNWPLISYFLYSERQILKDIDFEALIRNYLYQIHVQAKNINNELSYKYFESIFKELLDSEKFKKFANANTENAKLARYARGALDSIQFFRLKTCQLEKFKELVENNSKKRLEERVKREKRKMSDEEEGEEEREMSDEEEGEEEEEMSDEEEEMFDEKGGDESFIERTDETNENGEPTILSSSILAPHSALFRLGQSAPNHIFPSNIIIKYGRS